MTDWLKVGRFGTKAYTSFLSGQTAREGKRYEADQYKASAAAIETRGQREAARYRMTGEEIASAAKVAMAAQGAMVDSAVLAKIKKDAGLDAVAAMYDAKYEAMASRQAARVSEIEGKREYRAGVVRASSNLVSLASTFQGAKRRINTPWGGR